MKDDDNITIPLKVWKLIEKQSKCLQIADDNIKRLSGFLEMKQM
jgi:hypothetical protein